MLTLKEPIQLKSCRPFPTAPETFQQKILGNYELLRARFTPKDLLFLLTSPPELPEDLGGMTAITVQNSPVNRYHVTMEMLNQVVNRILLSGQPNFTYQDQVYITSIFNRLGVTDLQQFMEQVRQVREEHHSLSALLQLYRQEGPRLAPTSPAEEAPVRPAPPAARCYLHYAIYRRLGTAEIYHCVNAYQRSQTVLSPYSLSASLQLSEQLRISRQLSLNELRSQTIQTSPLTLCQSVNHYERGDLLPPPSREEQVLSQAAEAALLSCVSHALIQMLEQPSYHSGGPWLKLEQSLRQSVENTLARFEAYHGADAVLYQNSASYEPLLTRLFREESELLYRFHQTALSLMPAAGGGRPSAGEPPQLKLEHPAPQSARSAEEEPPRAGQTAQSPVSPQQTLSLTRTLLSCGALPAPAPLGTPPRRPPADPEQTAPAQIQRQLEQARAQTLLSLREIVGLQRELVLLEQTAAAEGAAPLPPPASTPPAGEAAMASSRVEREIRSAPSSTGRGDAAPQRGERPEPLPPPGLVYRQEGAPQDAGAAVRSPALDMPLQPAPLERPIPPEEPIPPELIYRTGPASEPSPLEGGAPETAGPDGPARRPDREERAAPPQPPHASSALERPEPQIKVPILETPAPPEQSDPPSLTGLLSGGREKPPPPQAGQPLPPVPQELIYRAGPARRTGEEQRAAPPQPPHTSSTPERPEPQIKVPILETPAPPEQGPPPSLTALLSAGREEAPPPQAGQPLPPIPPELIYRAGPAPESSPLEGGAPETAGPDGPARRVDGEERTAAPQHAHASSPPERSEPRIEVPALEVPAPPEQGPPPSLTALLSAEKEASPLLRAGQAPPVPPELVYRTEPDQERRGSKPPPKTAVQTAIELIRRERQRMLELAHQEPPAAPAERLRPERTPPAPQGAPLRPEPNPEAEAEQRAMLIQQLNEINRHNQQAYQKLQEARAAQRRTSAPARPDRNRMMSDALRAMEAPEEVIQPLLEQPALRRTLSSEAELLLRQTDESTRRLYEAILLYESNPQAARRQGIQPASLGALNSEAVRQRQEEELSLIQRQREDSGQEDGQMERVLEQIRETPARAGRASLEGLPARTPLKFIHRQENEPLTEEFIQRLERQKTAAVQQEVPVQAAARREVQYQTEINRAAAQAASQAEEITALIHRTLSRQMGAISDKVYQQMEKRLQMERYRRGRF